ncbi:hypothetical protein MKX03_022390 [Papaver bracteatum]|nr:hypothetical protein MKX03_022390 [Papaver bracteatum]
MEAAAATPTIIITSLNDDTVQELPLENRVPLVDDGEVGLVFNLNENQADVHAIMAQKLPKYVIIQSNLNNVYVHLYTGNPSVPNALRYTGDYSFDLDTRFEVVPATTGTGLIHIRCLRNNKYWANFGTGNNWVASMVDKPQENQSDTHCTLFQPIFVNSDDNRTIKLRHVGTGSYVRLFYGGGHYDHALCLLPDDAKDVCTFIDWESVVVLPDLIRIKGVNIGNHLQAYEDGFLDYNSQADNTSLYDYEVSPSRDGGIRLKSSRFGKYWMDMDTSDWVLLQKVSTTVHDANTVFLPTIIGGNRIIMRSLRNGLFCNRHNADGKNNCLATLHTWPDDWSHMDIEEPVISRKINDVIYHLTDARIYDEKNVALISDDSSNKTKNPLVSELNLKTTVSNSASWSTSVTLGLGVKMTVAAGVPDIASGTLEISGEVTKSSEWGGTQTETIEVGTVKTITVASMTRLKASLMAKRVSYDIPFSYTQRDILKNGSTKITEKNDGLFTGHNGYDYRYEVVPLPLE